MLAGPTFSDYNDNIKYSKVAPSIKNKVIDVWFQYVQEGGVVSNYVGTRMLPVGGGGGG